MTIEVAGQVFLVVLACIGVAAGVLAYFQTQKSKATIEILQQSDDAKQRLIDTQREQLVEQDKKIIKLQADLTAAVDQARVLTDMVTGKDALTNLTTMVLGLQASQDQILEALRRQR